MNAARCATLACTRKAAPGWAVCPDCRDRILYGHIPPSPATLRRLAR